MKKYIPIVVILGGGYFLSSLNMRVLMNQPDNNPKNWEFKVRNDNEATSAFGVRANCMKTSQ